MNGKGLSPRRLTAPLLAALVAACAAHLPAHMSGGQAWTYLGNDPEGTQNIYVQNLQRSKDSVTGLYRFEFTGPRTLTGSDLKQVSYVERRDLIQVDCKSQSLRLLDETYHDVDDKEVYHVKPAEGSDTAPVFAGGVSDIVYEGACGKSLEWTALGSDPQKTQDIYARVPAGRGQQKAIVKARFRFVYHDPREMVKSPSLEKVSYLSRQEDVMMDCANQTLNLVHETYYDADDVAVFGVTPPKDAPPDSVAPNSVTGIMYKAACGIPLDWTYLGMDPRGSQRVYLLGSPDHRSNNNVEARFRFEYVTPGKLTTGADLKQIEYSTRTTDVIMDCTLYSQTLLRESYQDASGKEVFTVKPPNPQPVLVSPQGVSGMLLKAGCQP
jgi:hypothetical protein